jgi:uncharacterized iron-regulated membrane protein
VTLAVLRRLHRSLGLCLALPLLIQGVSGALLAVRPWLPNPDTTTAPGEPSNPGSIIATAQAHAPSGLRPARYIPPATPGQLAQVGFVAASGLRRPPLDVWVDPVALVVRETPMAASAFDWLRSLHTNLLLDGRSGRSVIGYAGIGLLVLAIVGIPLWWPPRGRHWEAFTVDPGMRGRLLHRRLHGAAGAWSVALLLVMAATGVVTAFPQTARAMLGLPALRVRSAEPAGVPPSPADVDQAMAAASAAAPGRSIRLALLPASRTEPIGVVLAAAGAEGLSATVTAAIDPTGHLASLQDAQTAPTAERALRWAHDLHFGQGLGPVWRLLTVLSGLVLPVFAISGIAMWLHRRRRSAPILLPGE